MTLNIYAHLVILGAALLFSPMAQAADAEHVAKYKGPHGKCHDEPLANPCDLSNADLSNHNRNSMYMVNANAQGANFSGSTLSNMFISKANLSGANLSSTTYSGGIIGSTNLTGANLQGMVGKHGFSFNGNDLRDANLTGAKLRNLEGAYPPNKFCNTTMPDGTISNRDCAQ